MYDRRRVAFSKWTGVVLATFLLSQCIARWRSFFAAPTAFTYVNLMVVITLFLVLFLAMGIVIYAEEVNRGTLGKPRPWFQKWADRLFLSHQDSSRG